MTASDALCNLRARLEAAGISPDDARVEARLLLLHATGWTSESLRLRPDTALLPSFAALLDDWAIRRAAREPLAYLTGTRGFYGLDFIVSPAVLIPRPETEFVVEVILEYLTGRAGAVVADVGTGSGAIAVTVAVRRPDTQVWASDLSPEALIVAQANAAKHNSADWVHFVQGDLLAPLIHTAPFDVIASNPPYIAPGDIEQLEPEVRDWEPRIALGVHPNALHFYRRLAQEAPPLLKIGGLLVVEVGQGQAEPVAALWKKAGLTEISVRPDYAGIARVVSGVRS